MYIDKLFVFFYNFIMKCIAIKAELIRCDR